jgi:hypothetical protein
LGKHKNIRKNSNPSLNRETHPSLRKHELADIWGHLLEGDEVRVIRFDEGPQRCCPSHNLENVSWIPPPSPPILFPPSSQNFLRPLLLRLLVGTHIFIFFKPNVVTQNTEFALIEGFRFVGKPQCHLPIFTCKPLVPLFLLLSSSLPLLPKPNAFPTERDVPLAIHPQLK